MKAASQDRPGFWNRSHHLDRMTFRDLVIAYFQHYTIQTYLLLAAIGAGAAVWRPAPLLQMAASVVIAILVYPLVWYALHRWVLHSQWMYKLPLTAKTWKRIHYDHHQDPNHLEVLFGALYTTLPTIAVATVPVGYAIGGFGGASIAFATGLLTTCVYEFFHCIQHLAYKPKNKWVAKIKKLHLAHHFHDENGNYGITNYVWDRLFGTYYTSMKQKRSETVFNLGYTPEVAKKYPWVAELSGGVATGHPRRRATD